MRTQPDNRGHIRETFADSLTASSLYTEEGLGHVPPSTFTGKTELTNGWRHMVFIFRVKIHSCWYLFPAYVNFKSFMKSVFLTSFRFQCSAFCGCCQCVHVPGSSLHQRYDTLSCTTRFVRWHTSFYWKCISHGPEMDIKYTTYGNFTMSTFYQKAPRRWNSERVLI